MLLAIEGIPSDVLLVVGRPRVFAKTQGTILRKTRDEYIILATDSVTSLNVTNSEVRKMWSYTSTPLHIFTAQC
jgi:hypothetical protein